MTDESNDPTEVAKLRTALGVAVFGLELIVTARLDGPKAAERTLSYLRRHHPVAANHMELPPPKADKP